MSGSGPGTNTGHGHVWRRPDGARARCGGPKICSACATDAARFPAASLVTHPTIAEIIAALEPFDKLVGHEPRDVWAEDGPQWIAKDHSWGSRVTVEMVLRLSTLCRILKAAEPSTPSGGALTPSTTGAGGDPK